jgi:hypothetical protein
MVMQTVPLDDALEIARREIARLIKESAELSQYSFGEVGYLRENDRVWTFAAGSAELIEQGYIPGAVIVSIDKKDGHIWSREEMEQYAQQCERERMAQIAQAVV